jgi:hypothetical protein
MNALLLLRDNKPDRDVGLLDGNNFPVGSIDSLAKCVETKIIVLTVVLFPEAFIWTSIGKATVDVHGEVRE